MKVKEIIEAKGHENILASNKKTFEITKDFHLTKRGDCIVAVAANKSGPDLNRVFLRALQREEARLSIFFKIDGEEVVVQARGNPSLTISHPTDLVIRKSNFVCNRTLGVVANKTACDFSRSVLKKLREIKPVTIELVVTNDE